MTVPGIGRSPESVLVPPSMVISPVNEPRSGAACSTPVVPAAQAVAARSKGKAATQRRARLIRCEARWARCFGVVIDDSDVSPYSRVPARAILTPNLPEPTNPTGSCAAQYGAELEKMAA
jgi:hypothetical protein